MHLPGLLSVPTSLSEQLKRRTDELRSRIARSNYHTQFARTAPEVVEFRNAIADHISEIDDDALSGTFQSTVHFTTYSSYAALIAKFFEKPCTKSAVVDLLAPGLPDYLARSTATSGGLPKIFPLYGRFSKTRDSTASWTISDPLRRRTKANLSQFWYDPIQIEDETNSPAKIVCVTAVSVANRRSFFSLHPEEDEKKMETFLLDHSAPYAAGLIRKYRSFLLIQALFAAGSRSLETMTIPYTSMFVDMMHHLDAEFDMVMDCIASGSIPNLDGILELRRYLEVNISPDPERAAELRSLGRPSSQQGWCSRAWPKLCSITTTSSGSFATYIPLTRWFLGSSVEIRSRGYGSTEATIATPYDPLQLNKYKLVEESVVEFLDINKNESINSLAQVWEVLPGGRYEVVLTTRDGLWRYRLGDVVEVLGFDPKDGVPIIQFIERRNMALRFEDFMVTEKELNAAILSIAANVPLQISGWTAVVDDRRIPATIGFFIEVVGEQVSDLTCATQYVLDELLRSNENIAYGIKCDSFHRPTIRIVQPGTFSEFLQLKLEEGSNNIGQVKVPAVVAKAEYVSWFLDRVVREL